MDNSNENRRAYFRINDTVELQTMKLEALDDMALKALHAERVQVCQEANLQLVKQIEQPKTLKLISRRYPEIIDYIHLLEQRVAELDVVKNNQPVGEKASKSRQLVNLSADGIRFTSAEQLDTGSMIELILTLEPERHRFVIFGSVVRSVEYAPENHDAAWSTALHFTHIREEDQDYLIKHIATRQMENLRVKAI